MTIRFLIDECLSPTLAQQARDEGFVASTCVRDLGLSGTKDWALIQFAVAQDYTLVTHNAADFRGAGQSRPGGLYAKQPIHAGLVCLTSSYAMDLKRQKELFQCALDTLLIDPDLVNQALEIVEQDEQTIEVRKYGIPSS